MKKKVNTLLISLPVFTLICTLTLEQLLLCYVSVLLECFLPECVCVGMNVYKHVLNCTCKRISSYL